MNAAAPMPSHDGPPPQGERAPGRAVAPPPAEVPAALALRFADLLGGLPAPVDTAPARPRPAHTPPAHTPPADADAVEAEPAPRLPGPAHAPSRDAGGEPSRGPALDPALDVTRDAPRDDRPTPADALPSPMALFQRAAEPAPLAAPAAAPPVDPAQLALRIQTLAVGTDAEGQRRVRLTLADDALPETDVELAHHAGELQVDFFCRRAEGRQALAGHAPQLAETLAQRLHQPVCVTVGGAQRDDAGRVTAQARP